MNAVLAQSAGEQIQRYDAIRRRNAETAYDRNVQYNGRNQKTIEELEALLVGKKEPASDSEVKPEVRQLDAGQMKQVALPLGKTLEETIDLWRDVRADALTEPEPTTAEYQLAATASAKIRQTEAQIAIQNRIRSDMEQNAAQQETVATNIPTTELPSAEERELYLMQKRFQQAISAYTVQADARQNGYAMEGPSFSRTA
ncbi:hypothetical protein AB1K83_09960 [Sporosarcina sp. 179-K 3D1 HS]|uniref:hypothetical protein n=1 Tax=Sporosarcina sp. 179-K 3D1 HS TaxID=3232169 RepID=UPI00399F0796